MAGRTRLTLAVAIVAALVSEGSARAQPPCPVARPGAMVVYGDVTQLVALTHTDLASLPQVSVTATPHGGTTSTYSGPTVSAVLARAAVPAGAELRGAEMSRYLVVEAADGYRALFALAELDPMFRSPIPILAIRRDGQPLDAESGPLQVIVPDEQRHARWVRQVVCFRVARDTGKP